MLRERKQLACRTLPQPIQIIAHGGTVGLGFLECRKRAHATRALQQKLVRTIHARSCGQQQGSLRAAGGYAAQRDPHRITTEDRDVPLDPRQCSGGIVQPVIPGHATAFRCQLGMGEIAENADPVIGGHHDHAAFGEHGPIGPHIRAAAADKAAAWQP